MDDNTTVLAREEGVDDNIYVLAGEGCLQRWISFRQWPFYSSVSLNIAFSCIFLHFPTATFCALYSLEWWVLRKGCRPYLLLTGGYVCVLYCTVHVFRKLICDSRSSGGSFGDRSTVDYIVPGIGYTYVKMYTNIVTKPVPTMIYILKWISTTLFHNINSLSSGSNYSIVLYI